MMRKRQRFWGQGGSESESEGIKIRLDKVESTGAVSSDDNHIWFYDDVSQDTVAELVETIRSLSLGLREEQAGLELPEPRPIHLHIHSYGGDVFSGFAASDVVRTCGVPVHTHIEGGAASAATLISVVGKYRTIGKNSYVLIHQLSSDFWGKYEELKDQMLNYDLLMEGVRRVYGEHTSLSADDLDAILKRDLWFNAEKALACGLVDKIL